MILNHKIYGQGPALIILHGLFGSLDNWATHAKTLSQHFSVYLLDQRNHGRSPHDEEWNYEVMAEDLAEFMESQGIYTAHLLGHSMGGKTVMQFANYYPERIDKLIVADMAPKAYKPHHTQIIKTLTSLNLGNITSRQMASEQMALGIPEEDVRYFLLKGLGRDSNKNLAWKFNLPVLAKNYENVLQAIEMDAAFNGKTLFVSGGKSDYLKPSDHESILENFPNAVFEEIPQAGHWLHAEAPDAFIDIILKFLLNEN